MVFRLMAWRIAIAAPVVTTNWVDDRDPPIKIGYDEKEQRLTFDGNNAKLGLVQELECLRSRLILRH